MQTNSPIRILLAGAALAVAFLTPAALARDAARVQIHRDRVDVQLPGTVVELRLVRANVLHVHVKPDGRITPSSLVMSPDAPRRSATGVTVARQGHAVTLASQAIRVRLDTTSLALSISDPAGHRVLLRQADLADLARRKLTLRYSGNPPMYGIHGYSSAHSAKDGPPYDTPDCNSIAKDTSGLLRRGRAVAKACPQGGAGGPFVWTTGGFGVLVDTKGAQFDIANGALAITRTTRPDLSYYLITGSPKAIFGAVKVLSGAPQLFPKWAAGFTNSQWGIDQKQLLDIIRTYRAKHIPIDNFTLDYDWKAWGKDYGEFRWNPVKFPDGSSGKLARELLAEGVHITGIMKPRIFTDTVEGRYAARHGLWNSTLSPDAKKGGLRDVQFDNAAARRWYGRLAMAYAYNHGIAGWWNDEADEVNDNTQFLNMQRSLYDAQRGQTDVRVWSLNRSFWLGAQRYAYGLWSGDIKSSFPTMARQRLRMLNAITAGETLWGMDGGGFHGHPSDQNYARWIEFGAFTPVFRVHGEKPEKRQPWRYGPVAEKAASAAIRLRYRLIPYVYSYFWQGHAAGVGLVRPLLFDWPLDPKVRNDTSAWMFGDWLLVSPVVRQGQTSKRIYLPAGTWTDYFTGKVYRGGRRIEVKTDAKTWMDIPLFIRQGAIIPTQPLMQFVGQRPVIELSVDVFPDSRGTYFDYYDDDGTTYAYEHGAYYLQHLATRRTAGGAVFSIDQARGSYVPSLRDYLVKMHGIAAREVQGGGRHFASLKALEASAEPGWATGQDRYGAVTWVRLTSTGARRLRFDGGMH